MNVDIALLKHQHKFVLDVKTRFLALVSGYGAGKTKAMAFKAIYLSMLNTGFIGMLCSPTNAMAKDSVIPTLQETLEEQGIPYTYTATPYPKFVLHFAHGSSTVLIRSAENYKRLAGINLAWFGVDEADTIETALAHKMWKLLISRLRSLAPHIQGFTTSTPEGFGFMYQIFVKEPREKLELKASRRIIHASTYDNPYLEKGFITSLLETYPANLIKAYLDGQFVNLNTHSVYVNFDRDFNSTDKTLKDFDTETKKAHVHIGMDFNVGKCVGIVHIIDATKVYAIDEFTEIKNTEAMIRAIKQRYPDRRIYVYPDASSDNESTNASKTDLQMLRNAKFNVKAKTKNPRIKNRVNSMNAMFLSGNDNRRYYINISQCPVYVEALETQTYGKDGKPDKEHDQDHPNDAGGYFINYKFPIKVRQGSLKITGI